MSRGPTSERGVALVITLILLSVITFMAVTFLVVTRTEKGSVTTETDQTTAKLMADDAIEQAQMQIMAQMLSTTNPFLPNLLVSTNYELSSGFINSGPAYTWFTNVCYHYPNGLPVSGNDALQNQINSRYLPSPPVYVTNKAAPNSFTFQYYLDLNRNRRYDTNGLAPVISTNPALPFINTNGTLMATPLPGVTVSNFLVGDPEWVGVLERPSFSLGLVAPNGGTGPLPFPTGYGHSPSNRYVGRIAYVVVPTGLSLDINSLHNYGKDLNPTMAGGDGFVRDMGAGAYEINLGAFFTDLNTNYWPPTNGLTAWGAQYAYNPLNLASANIGAGFEDAVALLRYRYGANPPAGVPLSLYSVSQVLGARGSAFFGSDYVDGTSRGPVMTGFYWTPPTGDADRGARVNVDGWAGADNTNHLFDTQDFFDTSKTRIGVAAGVPSVTERLTAAGTNVSTYDAYTFYRLLQQLGTDSAADIGKMNLNYDNLDVNGLVLPDWGTNFITWKAAQFFTNAAARMLADTFSDTNVVVTLSGRGPMVHIQVYPTNFYLPSVHRLLQVAANLYDFNTTNGPGYPYFPTIFRPRFSYQPSVGTNLPQVFIVDYAEVTEDANFFLNPANFPFHDLNNPADIPNIRTNDLIYGIPLVVGAKKGFPNFNQLAMQTDTTVSRNLGYHRLGVASFRTNQSYNLAISNSVGVEAWNSYNTNYPRNTFIYCNASVTMGVTNEAGAVRGPSTLFPFTSIMSNQISISTNWPASGIRGTTPSGGAPSYSKSSFRLPLYTNYLPLPSCTFLYTPNQFVSNSFGLVDGWNYFPVPHWWLCVTTRLRFALVEVVGSTNRLIDYVNLSSVDPPVDIADFIQRNSNMSYPSDCRAFSQQIGQLFCTNRVDDANGNLSALTFGLWFQQELSTGQNGSVNVLPSWWSSYNAQVNDKPSSSALFYTRLTSAQDTTTDFQAPFSPKRVIHSYTSWSANDPLVHYTIPDLHDFISGDKAVELDDITDSSPLPDLGIGPGGRPLNKHYRPWSANGLSKSDTTYPSPTNTTRLNLAIKDPSVGRSDDWDFPTNGMKFPNLGWMGRVHRGTPWQTLYLKAIPAEMTNMWPNWSGHIITNWDHASTRINTTVMNDSIRTHPTNDFHLLDLFTTAFNDNSSRGRLPVNQTNLAAWSAVLSGVNVTTNTQPNAYTFIQPAGIFDPFAITSSKPPVAQIVDGIIRTRAAQPTGYFRRVGDVLNTPELTTGSPYLNTNNTTVLNDEVYERIPQQIMSLLSAGAPPRFVIYAFGQALKPAERSIMNNGSYFGLCTNYQVVAETAVRAVVRVEGSPDPSQKNNPDPAQKYPPRLVLENYNVLGPYY